MVRKVIINGEFNFGAVSQHGLDPKGGRNEVEMMRSKLTIEFANTLTEMSAWRRSDPQRTFRTSKEVFAIFNGDIWRFLTQHDRTAIAALTMSELMANSRRPIELTLYIIAAACYETFDIHGGAIDC
jgi:hypothetical protein